MTAPTPAPDARATVAFCGLGVMGAPMAAHLARAGHRVTVYNRTPAKAEAWVTEHGGAQAASPRLAAQGASAVFCCVGDDDDVRSVVMGPEGALDAMAAGSVLVDHTTASAQLARELAQACADRGVGFVDAPVSGGQAGAVNGQLSVMCGGEEDHFGQVAPLIDAYAKACTRLGPAGSGQLTKMVNQLAIAGVVQGLAEAMHFAATAGLDVDQVIDVIGKGAAQSWQLDNRGATMWRGQFDFGFAVEWMRKDLRICLDEGRRNGARLPVAALVDQLYAQVVARGGRRWDTSSLVDLLDNP